MASALSNRQNCACARKHYKHNEDGRTAPGVCGNGSVPLSHSGNVVTRIGIHTHSYCIFFHNYFYSQDDIVTMAILRLQICKRTRDTMVLSSGRNHRHTNKHPCCNKHPPRFWSQKWKIFKGLDFVLYS